MIAYTYPTRIGLAQIVYLHGSWRALIGEEDLGAYATAEQALDDLTGGHTFSHSSGVDTATLGLPDDLDEWTPARSR